VFGIFVEAMDVVKRAVVFIGCCLGRASLLYSLRSLRMMLIFEFLGRADRCCANSWFFAGFLQNSKELALFSVSVTLKSRRDRERPSGEEAGFSISNFSLGSRLFMARWISSAFSSLVVWR